MVYLAGSGVSAATMTPYDVCALRLGDGSALAGTPSDDAVLYLAALRSRDRRAAALTADGMVSAPDLSALLEGLCRVPWDEAEGEARGAGALIGAYPSDTS